MEAVCETIIARVLRAGRCTLLVCNCATEQEVLVHSHCACHFRAGQCVCIRYNGIMTMSLPPQITATCIERHIPRC